MSWFLLMIWPPNSRGKNNGGKLCFSSVPVILVVVSLSMWKRICCYLKECGCSAVLHTFSEEDYFFYRDTMKEIVEVSHRQGLKVYVNPWAVAGVFGGEAFSRFLVQNPETWQLCSDRKRYPTACLSHPKLRQFLLDWVEAAAYIGADAVMWDELHWFLPFLFLESNPQKIWGCRCEYCRHLFHEQFGYIMPEIQTSDVLSFQYTQMRRLLFELSGCRCCQMAQNKCLLFVQYR